MTAELFIKGPLRQSIFPLETCFDSCQLLKDRVRMSFEFITDGLTHILWRSHLYYRFESVRRQKDMKYLVLPALFCSCFSLSFQILHFLPLCVSHLQLCSASICMLTAFPFSLPDHLGATCRAFQHLLPCTFVLDRLCSAMFFAVFLPCPVFVPTPLLFLYSYLMKMIFQFLARKRITVPLIRHFVQFCSFLKPLWCSRH